MTITKEDLAIASPDALAPAAIEAKTEKLAETKAALPFGRCFVSAMLAGAFIGFGATFFGTFLGDPTLPFGVQRLVGGICFCLGLVLVLCCGAELFTGNILMVCGKASGKISWGGMLRSWAIVGLGNCAGSLFAVALMFLGGLQAMNGGAVGEAFVSIAAGKVALDPLTLFFKAIACNIFVCLAVWIGFGAKSTTDKVIGILLPISAFVACGFEHCVANMFFLPMGFALNLAGFGAAGAIGLGGIVYNIALATIGNIVGGAIVGLAYWYAYRAR